MENLKSQLEGVGTVAIAGHVRPDGDCVGSCMGLRQYIIENYPDKNIRSTDTGGYVFTADSEYFQIFKKFRKNQK